MAVLIESALERLLPGEHLTFTRLGKPEPHLLRAAAKHLGLAEDRIVMIGDQLETDVAAAIAAGIDVALLEGVSRWQPLIESWPASRFDGTLDYTTTKGVALSLPFAATLAHVFNHGTHHRGQVTAALTALGQPCPVIDLVYMLQEEQRTP